MIAPGPEPQDYVNRTISLIPSINIDTTPVGANFGDVIQQPPEVVRPGDTVRAQFVSFKTSQYINLCLKSHTQYIFYC